MLNKLLYPLLFAGLFVSKIGFAQNNVVKVNSCKSVNITKIKIKDTVLIMYLTQFIDKQLKEDSLFKKKGYVQVSPIHANQKQNVARSYHINKNYIGLITWQMISNSLCFIASYQIR